MRNKKELSENYSDKNEKRMNHQRKKVKVDSNSSSLKTERSTLQTASSSNESGMDSDADSSVIRVNDKENSIFSLEELSEDDEVYMFHCPENYDKKNLLGESLDFSNDCNISNKQTNELLNLKVSSPEKKFVTLALPSKTKGACLINVPFMGHISLEKVINTRASIYLEKFENNNVESDIKFPDNIKTRHPILGSEWKDHIKLVDEALKKNLLRKKIKKEFHNNEESELIKKETQDFEQLSPKKKKKKHEKTLE